MTNALGEVSHVAGGEKVNALANKASDYLAQHSEQLISGTIVLVMGVVITGWVARALGRLLDRRKTLEPPERLLVLVVVRVLLIGLTVTVALDVCGYPIGAIVGGLGALAVGIGFGMQGLVSNIIAGLTLIFTKPFRVGEYVETLGAQGLVTHVDVISTTLQQIDHSKVVIPNHKIVGEVLRNFGAHRQITVNVGVAYETDLKQARDLAASVLARSPHVLPKPAPIIGVTALKESAVALSIKFWVKLHDYEKAEGEVNESLVQTFRQNKIEIPLPQHEVHLFQRP